MAVCRPPYPLLQPSAAGLRAIWVITLPAPPATLPRRRHSADLGDIFEFGAQANLDPKVYEAAMTLLGGDVSDPIVDSDGIHIVVMNERRAPQLLDYDAVRTRVWADIKTEAQEKIKNATYRYLRGKADILTADS